MSLRITDTDMISTLTPHNARRVGDRWRVSWISWRLPLDCNQAITAMTVATVVASGVLADPRSRYWPHVRGWAAELNVTLSCAVTRTAQPDTMDAVLAALFTVLRSEVTR